MKKRLLAMLMALALLLTMLPAAALADDSADTEAAAEMEAALAEDSAEYGSAAAETTDAANPFVDVRSTSQYYYGPVLWAVEQNITAGTDSTHFSPNAACTRGQVVTFLYRAAGSPSVSGSANPFEDVKQSDYFYRAVLWAVSKGITKGTDSTHFSPNATCTRGQVVTFLYRAAEDTTVSSTDNPFTDVKASDYYYDAVLWAVAEGITKGTDSTHFSPYGSCTRAQVVTFLYRAAGRPEVHSTIFRGDAVVGSYVTFGSYEQDNNLSNGKEPIEWRVLEVSDGQALLISRYALDCKPFHTSAEGNVSWGNSSLQSWLNGTFYNAAFTSAEKASIQTTETPVEAPNGVPFIDLATESMDKLFLLANYEAQQLFDYTVTSQTLTTSCGDTMKCYSDLMCKATPYAVAQGCEVTEGYCRWWLRYASNRYIGYDATVLEYGVVSCSGAPADSKKTGVRPAMWVTLS